jgi:hypothetical protein
MKLSPRANLKPASRRGVFRPGAKGAAEEHLPHKGLVHHTEDGAAGTGERDQGRPCGHSADEGARAVDGIEYPYELGSGRLGRQLLAGNTVVGIGLLDHVPHDLFGGPVSFGDRIKTAVLLVVNQARLTKKRKDRLAGGRREAFGKIGPFFPLRLAESRHHPPRFLRCEKSICTKCGMPLGQLSYSALFSAINQKLVSNVALPKNGLNLKRCTAT